MDGLVIQLFCQLFKRTDKGDLKSNYSDEKYLTCKYWINNEQLENLERIEKKSQIGTE